MRLARVYGNGGEQLYARESREGKSEREKKFLVGPLGRTLIGHLNTFKIYRSTPQVFGIPILTLIQVLKFSNKPPQNNPFSINFCHYSSTFLIFQIGPKF